MNAKARSLLVLLLTLASAPASAQDPEPDRSLALREFFVKEGWCFRKAQSDGANLICLVANSMQGALAGDATKMVWLPAYAAGMARGHGYLKMGKGARIDADRGKKLSLHCDRVEWDFQPMAREEAAALLAGVPMDVARAALPRHVFRRPNAEWVALALLGDDDVNVGIAYLGRGPSLATLRVSKVDHGVWTLAAGGSVDTLRRRLITANGGIEQLLPSSATRMESRIDVPLARDNQDRWQVNEICPLLGLH